MFFNFTKKRHEETTKRLETAAEAQSVFNALLLKASKARLTTAEENRLEQAIGILGITPEQAEQTRAELVRLSELQSALAELPELHNAGARIKTERRNIELSLERAKVEAEQRLEHLGEQARETWRRIEQLQGVAGEVKQLQSRYHTLLGIADPVTADAERERAERCNIVLGYHGHDGGLRRITGVQLAKLSTSLHTSFDAVRLGELREVVPHQAEGQSDADFNRWCDALASAQSGQQVTCIYSGTMDDGADLQTRQSLVHVNVLLGSKSPELLIQQTFVPSQHCNWKDVDDLIDNLRRLAVEQNKLRFANV